MSSVPSLQCGLQRGWPSFSPPVVSRRGAPPSVDSSHSDDIDLLSSIEWRDSVVTAWAPSGLRLTLPRRSNFHRSSTVMFFFLAMRAGSWVLGVSSVA